jgi:hypothetical protein
MEVMATETGEEVVFSAPNEAPDIIDRQSQESQCTKLLCSLALL